jgi:hypothetical protein
MNRIILISLLLFSVYINTFSQNNLSFSLGFGTYSMEYLKTENIKDTWQYRYDNTVGINISLLSNFPPFFNYSFAYNRGLNNKLSIGYRYTFLTSGSRLYYEDYSGYWIRDIIANSHAIGFTIERVFFKKVVDFSLFIEPTLMLGITNVNSDRTIYPDYHHTSTPNYYSFNIGSNQGMNVKKIFGRISLDVKIGYYVDLYISKSISKYYFRSKYTYLYKNQCVTRK